MADNKDRDTLAGLAQWQQRHPVSDARTGLPRAGASLRTRDILQFDLDHARARDAVHLPFQAQALAQALSGKGLDVLAVQSQATDRRTYLQRPDLGRKLDASSAAALVDWQAHHPVQPDLVLVIGDGLSARAIHENAMGFVDAFLPRCTERGWSLGPVVVASQARVALADDIGGTLGARAVAILIGERPGLSAADSMGIYVTWAPTPGRTDAQRNCLSNIRRGGMSASQAARQLERLYAAACVHRLTGVQLKVDLLLNTDE